MKNNKNFEIEAITEHLKTVIKQVKKHGVEKVAVQMWAIEKEAETDAEAPLTCTEKVVRLLIGCGHSTVWRYYHKGKISKFSNGVYDLRSVLSYLRAKKFNQSIISHSKIL